MANWHGAARSNYFRVKDLDAFTAAVENGFGSLRIDPGGERDPEGSVCLLEQDGEGWPSPYCKTFEDDGEGGCANCGDEAHPDQQYDDIADLVAAHLIDDEVAVFMESGAEKLRYISGGAVAINNKGERVQLRLDDIYEQAKTLGANITLAVY